MVDANEATVIGNIPLRVVDEGSVLAFTVTASDADLPSQTLTYDLDPAWKARGATINENGEIEWSTGESDSLGSFTAFVFVSDGVTTSENPSPCSWMRSTRRRLQST